VAFFEAAFVSFESHCSGGNGALQGLDGRRSQGSAPLDRSRDSGRPGTAATRAWPTCPGGLAQISCGFLHGVSPMSTKRESSRVATSLKIAPVRPCASQCALNVQPRFPVEADGDALCRGEKPMSESTTSAGIAWWHEPTSGPPARIASADNARRTIPVAMIRADPRPLAACM